MAGESDDELVVLNYLRQERYRSYDACVGVKDEGVTPRREREREKVS